MLTTTAKLVLVAVCCVLAASAVAAQEHVHTTTTSNKAPTTANTCNAPTTDSTAYDDEISDQCIADHVTPYDYADPHLYSFVPRWERYSTNATDATTMAFASLPLARTAMCLQERDYTKPQSPYCKHLKSVYAFRTEGQDELLRFRAMATAMQNPERTVRYLENYPRVTHQSIMRVLRDAPIHSLGHAYAHIRPGDYSPFDRNSRLVPINQIRLESRTNGGMQILRTRLCIEQHMNAQIKLTVYVYHTTTGRQQTSYAVDADYQSITHASDLKLLQVVTNVPIRQCAVASGCKMQQTKPHKHHDHHHHDHHNKKRDDHSTTAHHMTVQDNDHTSTVRAPTNSKCALCKSNFYAEIDHLLPNAYPYGSVTYVVAGEGSRPHFTSTTIDYALNTENYNPKIKTFAYSDASYTKAAVKQVSDNSGPVSHATMPHNYVNVDLPHSLANFHVHTIQFQSSMDLGM